MSRVVKKTSNMPPVEHLEQAALILWARQMAVIHPALRTIFAIPNGGKRNIGTAVKLKAEGVRAGVPDLCLPVSRGGFNALYIEMKRIKNGKISPEQEAFIGLLISEGNCCQVAYGHDDAIRIILWYLNL